MKVAGLCRTYGIDDAMYYNWKAQHDVHIRAMARMSRTI